MRILHLSDRLSDHGGADHHLRDVLAHQVLRHRVSLAYGRADPGARLPAGVRGVRVRGLGSPISSEAGLEELGGLMAGADVVHLHNVMNPEAIRRAVATGRAIVTIQDHRVFCPGPGKTLPGGSACTSPMGSACEACLPEPEYRQRLLALTAERAAALQGARLIALSSYMARAIADAKIGDSHVIPPWLVSSGRPARAGMGWLLAGRMVAHKAPTLAWQAWLKSGSRHPLRVAGAGPLVEQLAGAEAVGWLPRGTFRAAARASRALLFPAQWQEPFGIAGLEALAEGTPVIATVRGGMGDWASAGCLAVEAEPAAMAEAIQRLERDPALAERLGAGGWEQVRAKFRREILAPKLDALVESVAG